MRDLLHVLGFAILVIIAEIKCQVIMRKLTGVILSFHTVVRFGLGVKTLQTWRLFVLANLVFEIAKTRLVERWHRSDNRDQFCTWYDLTHILVCHGVITQNVNFVVFTFKRLDKPRLKPVRIGESGAVVFWQGEIEPVLVAIAKEDVLDGRRGGFVRFEKDYFLIGLLALRCLIRG